MGENGEAGDIAESEFGIGKFAEVVGGNGEENLVAESLVCLLIGAKSGLIVVKNAVDFGDLGSGGSSWVCWVDGA